MACAKVNTISRHQTRLFSGLCVRFRAYTLHLAERPLPEAAVPGGWINLTPEGFSYASNVGIFSFSVMAQSLVNWPYRMRAGQVEPGHVADRDPVDGVAGRHRV